MNYVNLMADETTHQRFKLSTLERLNNLDFAKRGVTFDDMMNTLIDCYEES